MFKNVYILRFIAWHTAPDAFKMTFDFCLTTKIFYVEWVFPQSVCKGFLLKISFGIRFHYHHHHHINIISSSSIIISSSSHHHRIIISSSSHHLIIIIIIIISYHIIISSYHHIIISSKHQIIISSKHHITISSNHQIIKPSNHHIIISSYHHIIISSYHNIIISSYHHIIKSSLSWGFIRRLPPLWLRVRLENLYGREIRPEWVGDTNLYHKNWGETLPPYPWNVKCKGW